MLVCTSDHMWQATANHGCPQAGLQEEETPSAICLPYGTMEGWLFTEKALNNMHA